MVPGTNGPHVTSPVFIKANNPFELDIGTVMIPYTVQVKLNRIMFCRLFFSLEKCDVGKSIEMEVCSRPFCEKCASFETVDGCFEECTDVNNPDTCLCKESFTRDALGNCKKSNAHRTFSWHCPYSMMLLIFSSISVI